MIKQIIADMVANTEAARLLVYRRVNTAFYESINFHSLEIFVYKK